MPYPFKFSKDESFEESSESLIEHDPRLKKRTNRTCNWSFLRIVLMVIAIAVATIELIVFETIFVHFSSRDEPPQLLGELNKLVPDFPVRQVLFRKDSTATWDHKTEKSRNATRDNWLSYVPRGNGFIAVNNTNSYNLPDPILFRGQNAYSMAVFHQLHCLYTIMDMYTEMSITAGHRRRESGKHDHNHDHGNNSHQDGNQGSTHRHNHVDHCFRYLRQSLLCCGDTALEGQDPNTDALGTDGTGAVHVCKDFDAIRSWADGNRLVDSKHP
ncbi:hypothetical protein F5144DRAFT_584826 [Chaetomium tenue]|uniref:Uncharacterized protein n=1 Tax=Chaetomium tenue TaxID=1854479 RepID=A0ACB7NZY6_9PEZI|nr:hypothetical protein F5144DRAFT_584826 [Chaetomium globosum]